MKKYDDMANGKFFIEAVEELEKFMLTKALKEYKYLRKAANALGVNKSIVCRKVQKYKIRD